MKARAATVMVTVVMLLSGHVYPLFPFQLARQVPPSLPSNMVGCTVQTYYLQHPSIQACAALCLQDALCRLYCLKGNQCSLFSADVATWFKGSSPAVSTFSRCYTTRDLEPNDITHEVVSTTATDYYVDGVTTAEKAVNGFICKSWEDCFLTNSFTGYWRADLGASRQVATIKIQIRLDNGPYSHFNDVVITLGDSPDYNNPVFDTYPTMASPSGQVLTFTPPTPKIGQYLQLETNAVDRLMICNMFIYE